MAEEGGAGTADSGEFESAVPTQYPLNDEAYQGLPNAYPGNQPPPSWVPPVIGGPDVSGQGPAVGWKSRKVSATYVAGSGDRMGILSFDIRGTLEFLSLPGIFVTPQFGLHRLDGPNFTDLSSPLYDASLDVSLWRPIGEAWMLQFGLAPSIFTDGQNTSSDALRILGRFMAYYRCSPELQFAGGFVYLDRKDIVALPAAGVIYTPREDVRYELMFPKPRVAWRQYFNSDFEQWVYVTGELGGGSWAVERSFGLDDIATYRDLRLVLGLERKGNMGASWYVEGGLVFARELEFDSNIGNGDLDDTAFVRAGLGF
jgi:hypothetical protein